MFAVLLATLVTHDIDVANSTARFSVAHVWVERVTGTVPIQSGTVTLEPGSTTPSSVRAVLDATKIVTDEPDRNAALESPDFFDAAAYPTWTFVSTKITPDAHGFVMDGLLTMHGVTQPQELVVVASGDPEHPVYHATGQVNRHLFGMRRTRLDPVIGEMVDVTLDIRLK